MKKTFGLSPLAISIILLFLVCSVPLLAQNQAAAKGSNGSNPPMLGIYWAPGSHPVDTPKTQPPTSIRHSYARVAGGPYVKGATGLDSERFEPEKET